MGDMREYFDIMRHHNKERKAERLSKASTEGWSKHTAYHWYRHIDGVKFDYWPSSGLVMSQGKRYNINSKFIRQKIEDSK